MIIYIIIYYKLFQTRMANCISQVWSNKYKALSIWKINFIILKNKNLAIKKKSLSIYFFTIYVLFWIILVFIVIIFNIIFW